MRTATSAVSSDEHGEDGDECVEDGDERGEDGDENAPHQPAIVGGGDGVGGW